MIMGRCRNIRAACALAVAVVALTGVSGSAETLSGQAEVIDGDTIAIQGIGPRIRLYAIDTPEGQQTCRDEAGERYLCGSRAAEALASLIGRSGRVECQEEDRDRYGRIVAVCSTSERELNAEMVRQGWALEYSEYSDGRYTDDQEEARQARRGLWAGTFVEPWAWRRGERLTSEEGSQPSIQSTARRSCKAVSTCREAVIMWCNGYGRADGDKDGIPCESVCSSLEQVNAVRRELGC